MVSGPPRILRADAPDREAHAPRVAVIGGRSYPLLLPSIRDPRLHVAAVITSLQVLGQTSLHFDLSIPNFGIQEYMHHSSTTDEVFPHGYSYHAGYMHPGDAPGLGVDIDEKLAAKFPYQRAYLPVNRKMDGTLYNW